MNRYAVLLFGVVLMGMSGCQCCAFTEHYACLIDNISDHEHHYERFYSPCYDLNRIGRADWCACHGHRWFCECACNRCKPAPHPIPTCPIVARSVPDEVKQPDWSDEQEPIAMEEPTTEPEIVPDSDVPPSLMPPAPDETDLPELPEPTEPASAE